MNQTASNQWLRMMLLAGALLGGCTDPASASRSAMSEIDSSPAEFQSSGTAEIENLKSSPAVTAAIADLAQRLSMTADQIEFVEQREVTWSDTSIGCPQPGMAYAQRLVNGSLIVLRSGGRDYQYHSGAGRGPFFCADPQPPVQDEGGYGDV